MIRIHRTDLTTVVASLVSMFAVHVERDANLCEYQGVRSHVSKALIPQILELVA